MAGAAEPRVDRAVDEAQDVRDHAAELVAYIGKATADGIVTPEEAAEIARRGERVKREAEEVVVATEWTKAGQLRAVAALTGRDSVNAMTREAQVLVRASEIGMNLHA